MLLKRIQLVNYRNYNALSLNVDREGAIITGDNGWGKTNLLESIYYLAFGKSFRTNQDQDLINFKESFFRIEGEFDRNKESISISAAADKNNKVIKIGDNTLERVSELFGYFQTVYFSPVDLQIISGSPGKRRTFLDQAISQYDQDYLYELRNYRQILKQRNALLKSKYQSAEKRTWDKQFINSSRAVYEKRQIYLKKFIPMFKKLYDDLFRTNEKTEIIYAFCHQQKEQQFSLDAYSEQLTRLENQERLLQRSLIGPHLDDLEFFINKKNARTFASQGQMRCLSIIARITQALMISNTKGKPLLMFDDILSELDQNRRNSILSLLKGEHQVLIATPDPYPYKSLNLPIVNIMEVK